MTKQNYSLFHTGIQKIASSRLGAWYLARTQHIFDRLILNITGGRKTLTSMLTGLPVVMLTTTGAKSGEPRTIPLLCIRADDDPNTFAVIASNWGQSHNPAWYYNLKANPQATGTIEGQNGTYLAHEASGEEYEHFWRRAEEIYIGYPLYKARAAHRSIPIIVLTPET